MARTGSRIALGRDIPPTSRNLTTTEAQHGHRRPRRRSDRDILTSVRRIALVGASKNRDRPANEIQEFLQSHGFDVTPVNPGLAGQDLLGRAVVATLDDAAPLEMVDVFRANEHVPAIMDDAIRLRARIVWLQLGVVHEAAAETGRAAGLIVVMDRCPLIETRRLRLPPRGAAA